MKALVPIAVFALALTGCAQAETPGVLAGEAWTRTTTGTQMPEMTAVFVSLSNPSSKLINLVEADCGDVAAKTELHEMVEKDGQMVMQQTDAIPVPAEGHQHLAPGGPHIMLMGLTKELPVGGEEVKCHLKFDNGQEMDITAPIKEFTEEQESYHTHEEMDYGSESPMPKDNG